MAVKVKQWLTWGSFNVQPKTCSTWVITWDGCHWYIRCTCVHRLTPDTWHLSDSGTTSCGYIFLQISTVVRSMRREQKQVSQMEPEFFRTNWLPGCPKHPKLIFRSTRTEAKIFQNSAAILFSYDPFFISACFFTELSCRLQVPCRISYYRSSSQNWKTKA